MTTPADKTLDDVEANAGAMREEDAFDVAAVAQWLRENAHPEADTSGLDGTPEVRQFTGGASNLTYLLRYPERDLILRRPPSGTKAKGAHDMRREHDIQRALAPHFPAVAPMVAFCDDESVIGSEFYVMERLDGIILRQEIPPEMGLDEDGVRKLCETAIDELIALHSVDIQAAGLESFGKGEGYVRRQVEGWSARYRKARTHGEEHGTGSFETVMAWLDEHQPQDVANCLIHNDYRFDNFVLDKDDPTRILGILDWEMATLGDPLMDLGGALAYWVQADDDEFMRGSRRQPTHTPGMMTRDEVWSYYAEKSGRTIDPKHQLFYEVFGLFRLAVIAQQIYYRYANGQTHNPVFKQFRPMVNYLEWRCEKLIGANGDGA
ncbi:phosphotransferase family protein [Dermacoccus abyssi]|uniref:phosphotransferase family protein n=1 Tax=Dermacoccus abyssi TaxID=322596 RepID=UPI002AD436DC|nr:phosphotransferase family protein [Dermacoccus abyssi]